MTDIAFVDLDTVPGHLIEPIQAFVDEYRNAPRFERRVELLGLQFTLRRGPRGPRIRLDELKAVFVRFADLAAASERTLRRQTAELEARQHHDLMQSRSEFIALMSSRERGLLAAQLAARAEAEARVARMCSELRSEKEALTQQVTALTAAAEALQSEITRLRAVEKRHYEAGSKAAAEASLISLTNKLLRNQVMAITAEGDALRRQVSELTNAQCQLQRDHVDLKRQTIKANDRIADVVASADQALADNHRLTEEAALLRTEQQRLKDEIRRQRSQSQGEARATARFKRERDELAANAKQLTAEKQVLEDTNWWLTEKLRFRGTAANAA